MVCELLECVAFGPAPVEKHHPDLFWYGIHGVEALFTIMGPGCVSVTRAHTKNADVVTGVWEDGRTGTFRGIRNASSPYGAIVFGSKGVVSAPTNGGYQHLLTEVGK